MPLEEVPLNEQSGEPTPNIFTFTIRVHGPRGRGLLGADIAHIAQRGRGLTRLSNNLRGTSWGDKGHQIGNKVTEEFKD